MKEKNTIKEDLQKRSEKILRDRYLSDQEKEAARKKLIKYILTHEKSF